jgi:type VI secretion system protein ImpF
MAREKEMLFTQSLMERLSEKQDWPNTRTGSLRFLKESVRRDLEAVLNSRRTLARELDGYNEAAGSVLNYGIEDVSVLRSTVDGYIHEMQRIVQQCISQYEPRLTDVSVSVEGGDLLKREIRLHIEAHLPLHPSVEMISFDTVFDVTSETYLVG